MTTNNNKNEEKKCLKFYCDLCDYGTAKKSSFVNHCESMKHKRYDLTTNINENYAKICSNKYPCVSFNKIFNDRSGLWRHKKKCTDKELDINDKDSIIMHLLKQNSELQQSLVSMSKEKSITNINTNTNNSHNKTFNLQVFLNETCKDALNIQDFVSSIQFNLEDLENTGRKGYIEGISNIITTNLKALDVTQRPIHCTDKKREIIYIKDENKWEKEADQKNKLRKAIRRVATKNQILLLKFREAHPDGIKSTSKYSDQYSKIIIESMGGSGDNDIEKEDKIIRQITNVTTIDK